MNSYRDVIEILPPEWISAPQNIIYVSNDMYVSVIMANEQVIDVENDTALVDEYKKDFSDMCLDYFNKISPSTLNVEKIDDYIDLFPNIGHRLLLGIKISDVESLSDKEIVVETYENEVVYNIVDYKKKINFVIEKFKAFQQDMLRDIYDKKSTGYQSVDFSLESENLQLFNDNLTKLFNINKIAESDFENIKLCYDKEFLIKRIYPYLNSTGEDLIISFSQFQKTHPQNRAETNYFVFNLGEVYRGCKNTEFTYEDAIKSFFYRKRKVISEPSNMISRAQKNSTSYGIDNKSTTNNKSSAQNISKRFSKEVQRIASQSIYNTPCLSNDEKKKKDKELKENQKNQDGFAKELTYAIGDTFVDNLPGIMQKVAKRQGKEAANALGTEVLNRLGVCGLGDIVALVANTTSTFLNAEEYNKEVASCALNNLDDSKLEKLDSVLEKLGYGYKSILGSPDILPPWKTGGYRTVDNPPQPQQAFKEFSLKLKNPSEGEDDIDAKVKLEAYRGAVIAEVKTEDLLQALVSSFPDEMGWISFFADSTTALLQKCAGIGTGFNSGSALNKNFCKEKNFKLPKISNFGMTPSGPFSPSSISKQLLEEIKNIIINLIIQLITSTMQQLFQIIAAGMSGDKNYFKRQDYIPDLFQDEEYFFNAFCDRASNKKRTKGEVMPSIRQMMYDSTLSNSSKEISLNQVDQFLKDASVSLGEYEKIELLRGNAPDNTFEKLIFLVSKNNLTHILTNKSDIEKFFLEMGKRLDVSGMEADYFDDIYSEGTVFPSFCIIENDMLERAYLKNKDGITKDQIEDMKQKLKDIQKDKICTAASAMGDPNGPILGQLGKLLLDKSGPLYKKANQQEAKYFMDAMKSNIKTVAASYQTGLYINKGVYDTMMRPDGKSYNTYLRMNFGMPPSTGSVLSDFPIKESFEVSADPDPDNLLTTSAIEAGLKRDIGEGYAYFKSNIFPNLINNYNTEFSSSLQGYDFEKWKKSYSDFNMDNNGIERISSLFKPSLQKISDIYAEMPDFNSGNGTVPFHLLKNKNELIEKFSYISFLVQIAYTDYLFKTITIFSNYEKDTDITKNDPIQHIYDQIFDSKSNIIFDNMTQILYKIQDETINRKPISSFLSKYNSQLNSSIESWLDGGYSSYESFYRDVPMEDLAKIFINFVIDNFSQDKINKLSGVNADKNLESLIFSGDAEDPRTSEEMKLLDVGSLPTFVSEKYYEGINPAIKIYAIYEDPDISSIPSEYVTLLSDEKTQVVALPLISHVDLGSSSKDQDMSRWKEDRMKEELVSSENFKKYYYPAMNIEQILSFYTNYYIEQVEKVEKDFFKRTKKVLKKLIRG